MSKILPQLSYAVWILALGRLLSQTGTGFTLFYAPIYFVNQVGLSATSVGIALGSASISGILGRFLGGSLSDSSQWGRRGTLLLSAVISAIASFYLCFADDFLSLVIANLLMGLGIGIYWPATEACVADLTIGSEQNEAFAITRLADNLGLSMGVALGGALIAMTGEYRTLFVIDGISFIIFFMIVYLSIKETYKPSSQLKQNQIHKWLTAIKDKRLWVFMLVNILFTIYISQIQTTLPLYLTNFTATGNFNIKQISILFTLHITLTALLQLPVIRVLSKFTRIQTLIISLNLWGISFILIWITGNTDYFALFSAFLALLFAAIATVSYTPSASGIIVELAPTSLRGIYFALNSQCWAIGYLIGPPLGGWVLDKSATYAHNFWLLSSVSIVIGILILKYLETIMKPVKD